jgi:hypothetical protein
MLGLTYLLRKPWMNWVSEHCPSEFVLQPFLTVIVCIACVAFSRVMGGVARETCRCISMVRSVTAAGTYGGDGLRLRMCHQQAAFFPVGNSFCSTVHVLQGPDWRHHESAGKPWHRNKLECHPAWPVTVLSVLLRSFEDSTCRDCGFCCTRIRWTPRLACEEDGLTHRGVTVLLWVMAITPSEASSIAEIRRLCTDLLAPVEAPKPSIEAPDAAVVYVGLVVVDWLSDATAALPRFDWAYIFRLCRSTLALLAEVLMVVKDT